MKHCAIPDAVPDSWVWGIEDGLHFLSRQVPDEFGISFLCGDGHNALDLFQSRRHAKLHVMHKGLDGREPDVSRTSAISTFCFQMTEEVHDQRSIDMLQVQLRWRNLDAIAGVFEEKLKGVGIRVTGVRTGAPFDGQALLEESGDMRCNGYHGRPPLKKLWHESAMLLISSGVASKYQYVWATLL